MTVIERIHERIEQKNAWSKSITIKRNAFLTTLGATERNLYYVNSGALRVFMTEDHTEHTIRFGYKNNFITALDSFITSKPSEYGIQALKETELNVISKPVFQMLISEDKELNELWILVLQELVVQQMEREKDLLISSPKERYERVLKRSPQLFQEVPNKYIASYLRMSPETLSRLKKS